MSLPAPPSMTLAPALPRIVCAKVLPVRLIAPVPALFVVLSDFDLLSGGQGVAHARQDVVAAAARRLVRDVAGVVDKVGVVAAVAVQLVDAGSAIQMLAPALPFSRLLNSLPVRLIAVVPAALLVASVSTSWPALSA